MNLVHKIEVWGDHHHPWIFDITRIALGAFLLLKGIMFMENTEYLKELIARQNMVSLSAGLLMTLVYYVTFAHMVGGVLILLGTLTRFASIIQMPIVLAAVFMSNIFREPINAMAWPSLTALGLLILFTIIGSGPVSLDRYLSNWEA